MLERNSSALVIPKSWKFTVLVEVHDKLGHQGNSHTYCLIKHQYYWKGMNKDIWKYIANCILCRWDKAKVQQYPLQMTEIPDKPFDKIAIDMVTFCKTSTSGNKHILTIIDHLTGWLEAFPIPNKSCRHHSHYSYQPIFTSTHVPQIHPIRQWHGVQKQPDGSGPSTTGHR